MENSWLNGQIVTQYIFKMNYFWMMGDYRHGSQIPVTGASYRKPCGRRGCADLDELGSWRPLEQVVQEDQISRLCKQKELRLFFEEYASDRELTAGDAAL